MLIAGVLAAACQPTPPPVYQVERSRTYSTGKEAIWPEIQRFLAANDISVSKADRAAGTILAQRTAYQDAGWAACEIGWVVDNSSNSQRRGRPRPVARDLALAIAVQESARATTVKVDARFEQELINPFRNLPFERPCRSRGVLESALLDALDRGPGGATTSR